MKKVKLELTIKEAQELQFVANNGYGDGDFYQKSSGYGEHSHNTFIRADAKLTAAITKAATKK